MTEGDLRRHLARFQKEAFEHNMGIVRGVQAIAARKGVTPAQLSISWVQSLGPHVFPLAGSS